MNIVLQVNGGVGTSIAATAVCKALKKYYPDERLIVLTAYPEIYFGNPNVYKALNSNELTYFYSDYIDKQDVKLHLHDPYLETDFVMQRSHLIKVWCEMCNVPYSNEQPELYLSSHELEFYKQRYVSDKPMMLLQTNGGSPDQVGKYSWVRDLPIATAQKVVNEFSATYNIVHIKREDQLTLEGVFSITAGIRAIISLIALSEKRLLIDSFCQHAAAALCKPSVVCWIGTNSRQHGYDIHFNITAHMPTERADTRGNVFNRYDLTGKPAEFCYRNEDEIFDVDVLIDAINDCKDREPEINVDKSTRGTIVSEHRRGSMVASRLMHLLNRPEISNVKQILDIGSWHLGQSIEFAKIFPQARIDAFEPVPASYNLCLAKLQELSSDKRNRINVHNIALSDHMGTIPFFPVSAELSSVPNVGASSMFRFVDGLNGTPFGQHLVQDEITVATTTLDEWSANNNIESVDILWMDVQGAELLVLQGGIHILKNTRIIMTEVGLKAYYEGHTLKQDIDTLLQSLGFRELEDAFEINVPGYEANTIYVRA